MFQYTKMDFPADLEEEILAWLPAEDLCKFRSVCSEWNFLFSSTRFITREWTEAPPNRKPWLLIDSGNITLPCLRYCFFTQTWKTCLSLSFIKEEEKENVADIAHLQGSSAGLFLLDYSSPSISMVCNPLAQTYFKLPSMSSIKRVEAKGIVGRASEEEAYKVVAVGWSGNREQIIEIYDSSKNSWRVAARMPEGFSVVFGPEEVVFWDGFFYFNASRSGAGRRLQYGIMGFSMEEVPRMPAPIFAPLEKLYSTRSWPTLLVCGSRLLVAGIGRRERDSAREEMIIWEFQKMDPIIDSPAFKEIASIPSLLQKPSSWFQCAGVGDCVCFTVHGTQHMEVAIYSLSQNSWRLLPSPPISFVDLWRRSCVAFEPRPDMKVE